MISGLVLQKAARTFYISFFVGLLTLVVVQLSHCAPEATPAFKAGSCSLTNLKCV